MAGYWFLLAKYLVELLINYLTLTFFDFILIKVILKFIQDFFLEFFLFLFTTFLRDSVRFTLCHLVW